MKTAAAEKMQAIGKFLEQNPGFEVVVGVGLESFNLARLINRGGLNHTYESLGGTRSMFNADDILWVRFPKV